MVNVLLIVLQCLALVGRCHLNNSGCCACLHWGGVHFTYRASWVQRGNELFSKYGGLCLNWWLEAAITKYHLHTLPLRWNITLLIMICSLFMKKIVILYWSNYKKTLPPLIQRSNSFHTLTFRKLTIYFTLYQYLVFFVSYQKKFSVGD